MATLRDVAQAAGVSLATASRALNGTYRKNMSESTRRRVLETARTLGYQPSVAARALRNKTTYLYGLVVPDVARSVMPDVVQGLQSRSLEMNYSCLLYVTHHDPKLETKVFRLMVARRVDGAVWLPAQGEAAPDGLASIVGRLPIVQILYRTPLKGAGAVLVDQAQGGYLAARHVLELGHRRIACLWVDDPHGRQRLVGYRRAMAEAGLAPDPSLMVEVNYDWQLGRSAAQSLLARSVRPTAIVAASDIVAWGAIRAAKEAGMVVPGDLSVVGFDDMPLAGYGEVPLTTVRQPTQELGRQALGLLRERINGNSPPDRVLAPELVVRASAGPVGSD